MKLIVTENQLNKILEDKQEVFKHKVIQRAKDNGIYSTARELGMDTNDFIDKFELELNDSRIEELIDFYMENKFHKVYDFKKKLGMCDLYETPGQFLTVVTEAINEFCYNNFNFTTHYNIDEEDIEFENLFYLMEHYLIRNYGELIENTFIKNCEK